MTTYYTAVSLIFDPPVLENFQTIFVFRAYVVFFFELRACTGRTDRQTNRRRRRVVRTIFRRAA